MKRSRKLNYASGTVFVLPLRDGGYARGVVARLDGKGVVFGHFFAPRIESAREATMADLCAGRAVLVGKFGDLSLLNGEWPIVGQLPGWKPDDWPMPPLIRVDDLSEEAILSHYDERTFECTGEEKVSSGLVDRYPYDRTMGSGSVEVRLTALLAPK